MGQADAGSDATYRFGALHGIRWMASFKQRRPTPVLLILVKSSSGFGLTRLLSPPMRVLVVYLVWPVPLT